MLVLVDPTGLLVYVATVMGPRVLDTCHLL